MNAETAKQLAQNQREKIIETIQKEVIESIGKAISKGLFEIYIPVDTDTEGLKYFRESGYEVTICPDNEYKISIRVSWQ